MNIKKETENWIRILLFAMEEKPQKEAELLIKKMTLIFKKRKKEAVLKAIFKKARKLYLERQKIELIFARKQQPTLISGMEKVINKKFGSGKKTEIKIDPEILGGFRIKSHNFLIKSSLKDFLNEAKNIYVSG